MPVPPLLQEAETHPERHPDGEQCCPHPAGRKGIQAVGYLAEFIWDNTAGNPRNPNSPPKQVNWGEGSTDEMSGLIIGGVTVRPWEELGMWASVIGHYFEVEKRDNEGKKRHQLQRAPKRE